jgi:hypothetical protein
LARWGVRRSRNRLVEKGVHEEPGPAEELTALREAVLRHHDDLSREVADSRIAHLLRRLHRLHLSWLAVPWLLLGATRVFLLGGPPGAAASEERAVALYRQHSGKDPLTARVEVARLVMQLGPLDDPADWAGHRRGLPRVDRDELEAAADALIAYYLACRRTDDTLLGEVLAVWAEWDELLEQTWKWGPGACCAGAALAAWPRVRIRRAWSGTWRPGGVGWTGRPGTARRPGRTGAKAGDGRDRTRLAEPIDA